MGSVNPVDTTTDTNSKLVGLSNDAFKIVILKASHDLDMHPPPNLRKRVGSVGIIGLW